MMFTTVAPNARFSTYDGWRAFRGAEARSRLPGESHPLQAEQEIRAFVDHS